MSIKHMEKFLERKAIVTNMEKEERITFHQLFWYFIIFSVAGIIIETLYCYATTGVLESRKGLLWGPFCPVYGVSAAVIILMLYKYKDKNIFELFISGFIAGSIAEYILSFGLEAIYGIRFWEYSYIPENINGRICIPYSIFWGVLSVIVIKMVKPLIDKIIKKIPKNIGKEIEVVLVVLLIIDALCTIWAIEICKNDVLKSYNGVIEDSTQEKNYIERTISNIEEMLFPKERVLKTFPNLRIKKDNEEVFIRDLL